MSNPFLAKLATLKAAKETTQETTQALAEQVTEQTKTLSFAEKLALKRAAQNNAEPIKQVVKSEPKAEPKAEQNEPKTNTNNPFLVKLKAKIKAKDEEVNEVKENKTVELDEGTSRAKPNAFLERIAALKAGNPIQEPEPKAEPEPKTESIVESEEGTSLADESEELVYYNDEGRIVFNTSDRLITLNDKQMLAVEMASKGESFVLTGAAGTGKTTAQAGVVWSLHQAGAFGTHDFKYIGTQPSIALVAFTKVAVRNMQKALRRNPLISAYSKHCMTIHSLLEYTPEEYTEYDIDTGEDVTKWGFRPQRHAGNPLTLTHLIIEEASMVDLPLWQNLFDALLPDVQIIFLGDINQLKPVFGDSILAYALNLLPVIELTEVYRQALESPIIKNAHNILSGRSLEPSKDGRFNVVEGKMQLKVGQETMARAMIANIKLLVEHGKFNLEEDMILCPWNKHAMGTTNLNEEIATWLGLERQAVVYEVRAGRHRWWLAEGDKVLVDKRLGHIVSITPNPTYRGADTKVGAYSRTGVPIIGASTINNHDDDDFNLEDYTNFNLGDIESADDLDSNSRAASHTVGVVFIDDDMNDVHEINTAGGFAPDVFQFGYCLTVHKAQGSEWPRVILMTHWDHATTLNREFLYTAVTRAAEEFTVFGKSAVLDKAIARASFKGSSLDDKIAYFRAGASYRNDVPLLSKLKESSK